MAPSNTRPVRDEDGSGPRPVYFIPPPPIWPSFGQQGEILMVQAQKQAKSFEITNASQLRRHPRYYLRAGDLHFSVGRYLFRVHKHFFQSQSSYFRKLLAPAASDTGAKGFDDNNAIVLDDVLAAEFECFLTVFYKPQYAVTSQDDWMLILELADHWSFPDVKRAAARALDRLGCPEVDRIVAYQTYSVGNSYVLPLYASLVAREEPLTPEEGEKLGMQTAIRIAQLRETTRSKATRTSSKDPESGSLRTIIRDTFKLPAYPSRCASGTISSSSSTSSLGSDFESTSSMEDI